jgi:hypothetical protein
MEKDVLFKTLEKMKYWGVDEKEKMIYLLRDATWLKSKNRLERLENLLSFVNAIRGANPAKMTILGFVILIGCLYTVGEVAIDHGIEILFFLLALISALLLTPIEKTKITNQY